jgi:hypothetical protein
VSVSKHNCVIVLQSVGLSSRRRMQQRDVVYVVGTSNDEHTGSAEISCLFSVCRVNMTCLICSSYLRFICIYFNAGIFARYLFSDPL